MIARIVEPDVTTSLGRRESAQSAWGVRRVDKYMNEKDFRKWAKERDLIVSHSRRVSHGWCLSIKLSEKYTLCCARSMEALQDWAFSDRLKKELHSLKTEVSESKEKK